MLNDLNTLLKRNEDINEEDVKHATYALMNRQFLHHAKPRHRAQYDLIVRFQKYFGQLMDAANYHLIINEHQRYVGIVPQDYVHRLKVEDTIYLLVLRAIYDEEIVAFKGNDDGSVDIALDELEMRYTQLTDKPMPDKIYELEKIFLPLQHFGIIEIGNDDDRPEFRRVRILPTITAVLSGEAVERIKLYLKVDNISLNSNDDSEEVSV